MSIVAIERLERTTGDEQLGQVRVRRTEVSVYCIVIEHRSPYGSPEEIATTLGIKLPDVYAALAYYYDHQQAIDDELAKLEAEYVAVMMQHPSAVQAKLARVGLSRHYPDSFLEG